MVTLAWVALALALTAVEIHSVAFYAVFGSIGAVVAAALSLVFPSAYAAQIGVALAAALVGILMFRPYVSRAFLRGRDEVVAVGVHGGLVGERVIALDEVSGRPGGHVVLAGETWLARTVGDELVTAGEEAVVTAVRGTTLIVLGSTFPGLTTRPLVRRSHREAKP